MGGFVVEHLYVHIPFCPKLCPYCSFFVETGSRNKNQAFLDALLRELEMVRDRFGLMPKTIYFGGGTPSSLLTGQLEYLLAGLRERISFENLEEFGLEANPSTVRKDKADVLKRGGINRISLGVQSWDDEYLKVLGRVHNSAQAEKTYGILRDAGFDNINIDLMFAVPAQSLDNWKASLDKTALLAPEHVSCYCLTYEEDTQFFEMLRAGTYEIDRDEEALFFEATMASLENAGYAQYEISNYAKPGFESRHNRAYWAGADYLGIGPGAFSTVGLERWENVRDTAKYVALIAEGKNAGDFRESLSPRTRAGEIAAFGIRTQEGLSTEFLAPWIEPLQEYVQLGLVESFGERMRLTGRGRMLADSVAEVFISSGEDS